MHYREGEGVYFFGGVVELYDGHSGGGDLYVGKVFIFALGRGDEGRGRRRGIVGWKGGGEGLGDERDKKRCDGT